MDVRDALGSLDERCRELLERFFARDEPTGRSPRRSICRWARAISRSGQLRDGSRRRRSPAGLEGVKR